MSGKKESLCEGKINIQKQLFIGKTIWLGPIDQEKDPVIMSRWTRDPEYLSLEGVKPVYPLSIGQIQKRLEVIEKELDESKNFFYFTIRARENDRLLGFASIRHIEWTHSTGWVHLGIGDRNDWHKGYGTETLDLLLEYAFNELNLYRLTAEIMEYNSGARRLFEKAGFLEEVCRRKALRRDGQCWNVLLCGLLREEWEVRKQ